ncbi:hypothetical protein K7X08_016832 [Anisodus acutangulus]|uniref:Uncharacterized protein n=1 Tax=Anisodus acutangulus TaxID=402998 RepID=A0A9Q1LSC2_9SOLA|nr:hypothetical protein K7X08_016832 [Anisodus acutangulus]
MYHIVERKFCRCGRYPPDVRTAIPVDGRFEHIVLSCNATSDHGIIWIEKESEKAFARLKEASAETATTPPKVQKIERLKTLEKEHKDALERAVSLNIPHAVGVDEDESSSQKKEEYMDDISITGEVSQKQDEDASTSKAQGSDARTNWNEVVEKLFNKDKTGKLQLQRAATGPQ